MSGWVRTGRLNLGLDNFRYVLPMPTIYISDSGDDKNDGLSLQTAVYSLKRAKKLQGGRNDYSWHFGPRA